MTNAIISDIIENYIKEYNPDGLVHISSTSYCRGGYGYYLDEFPNPYKIIEYTVRVYKDKWSMTDQTSIKYLKTETEGKLCSRGDAIYIARINMIYLNSHLQYGL